MIKYGNFMKLSLIYNDENISNEKYTAIIEAFRKQIILNCKKAYTGNANFCERKMQSFFDLCHCMSDAGRMLAGKIDFIFNEKDMIGKIIFECDGYHVFDEKDFAYKALYAILDNNCSIDIISRSKKVIIIVIFDFK